MDTLTTTTTTRSQVDAVTRWLPLAAVGFAVLQIAGDLTIGEFPDESTSLGKLTAFYAAHHAQVALGGRFLEVSAAFLALFGAALCARIWRFSPVAAAIVGIGAAMDGVAEATSGATYNFLGDLGATKNLSPQALQAWHVGGAGYGTSAGVVVLVLGIVVAALTTPAVPQWLAWSGLVLALAQFTPVGFLASMLFLVWMLVAGVVLMRRD